MLDKPMTIKIRIGRDEKNPTVHKNIVPYVHLWGASALTVRSATAHQMHRRSILHECAHSCRLTHPFL